MKIKESEKRDNYLDLAGELKKAVENRETVIPIVIGALGTVPKGLEKGTGRVLTLPVPFWRTNGDHAN